MLIDFGANQTQMYKFKWPVLSQYCAYCKSWPHTFSLHVNQSPEYFDILLFFFNFVYRGLMVYYALFKHILQ